MNYKVLIGTNLKHSKELKFHLMTEIRFVHEKKNQKKLPVLTDHRPVDV